MVLILTLSLPDIRHVIKEFTWIIADLLHITKQVKQAMMTDYKRELSSLISCGTLSGTHCKI